MLRRLLRALVAATLVLPVLAAPGGAAAVVLNPGCAFVADGSLRYAGGSRSLVLPYIEQQNVVADCTRGIEFDGETFSEVQLGRLQLPPTGTGGIGGTLIVVLRSLDSSTTFVFSLAGPAAGSLGDYACSTTTCTAAIDATFQSSDGSGVELHMTEKIVISRFTGRILSFSDPDTQATYY
jgi:hypothetical protein